MFDIVKLTDTEFEFTATGTTRVEGSNGSVTEYDTSFTVKLARMP